MPEVAIGLFPDVGGAWFLNKMPRNFGLFMALTGVSINALDTLYLNFADHLLDHTQWDNFLNALSGLPFTPETDAGKQISRLLNDMAAQYQPEIEPVVENHIHTTESMVAGQTLDEIYQAITQYHGDDKWLQGAAKSLQGACPISVAVTYQHLQRAMHYTLKTIFQTELILSANFMRAPNFVEGVRALLVDKDRNPSFVPATYNEISDSMIEDYFKAPWGHEHPLNNL